MIFCSVYSGGKRGVREKEGSGAAAVNIILFSLLLLLRFNTAGVYSFGDIPSFSPSPHTPPPFSRGGGENIMLWGEDDDGSEFQKQCRFNREKTETKRQIYIHWEGEKQNLLLSPSLPSIFPSIMCQKYYQIPLPFGFQSLKPTEGLFPSSSFSYQIHFT